MTKFYNPYQFIPFHLEEEKPETVAFEHVSKGEAPFIRHDRWEEDAVSGSIVCKLTTISPLVIGARQEGNENEAKRVIPYRDGQYLPANSLRGMIASVAEAISNSSMRVLSKREKHEYAVRKTMYNSLKAIGLLRKDKDGWYITPLALSALQLGDDMKLPRKWQRVFEGLKLKDCLAHYVGDYSSSPDQRTSDFHDGAITTYRYIRNNGMANYPRASAIPDDLKTNDVLSGPQDGLALFKKTLKPRHLTTTGTTRGVYYITGGTRQYKKMPHKNKKTPQGKIEIPKKKHELFIPWPESLDGRKRLLVGETCVNIFNSLLLDRYERTKTSKNRLPLMPIGYEGRFRGENPQVVKEGDLLYFDVDDNGEIVTELSYSAIWRKPVGNLYDRLEKMDRNLLPWNPDRNDLTPAEALFGVVEDGKEDKARNLASRLRFHDAKAETDVTLMGEQLLKILASPKPPSPSMYFRTRDGKYIAKSDLNLNNSDHKPNGRKRYLPHPQWDNKIKNKFKWETQDDNPDRIKQKMWVRPIPDRQAFLFTIDFDNLSPAEYTLLRTAIAPGNGFQHQLGLGKPLGLGQIEVEILEEHFINRKSRYSLEGIEEARCNDDRPPYDDTLVNETTLKQLQTLGNPGSLIYADMPVCYPFTTYQKEYNEDQGFKWFMDNESSQRPQRLGSVQGGWQLPPLDSDTNNWKETELNEISLSAVTLALAGVKPKSQREYDEDDVITAIEKQWPGTQVIKCDLGNSHIRLEPGNTFDVPCTEQGTPFEVKGETLVLRQPKK